MAGDMKKFFDPSTLDSIDLGMIEFVLTSPAYDEHFKPYLLSIRNSMNTLWLDRSEERKKEYPDDFLAGGVAAIDGMLALFANIVADSRMERIHESMARLTSEDQYDAIRRRGGMKPVVGLDQPAEPDYDPAEDF